MKMFVLILVSILLTTLALLFIFGTYRTIIVHSSPNQKAFAQGKVSSKSPDGIYKGTVHGIKVSWIGKQFSAKTNTGINNFKENGKVKKQYPFKTYIGQGIADNKEVFKIDYDVAGNPLWLKFILDEVVETKPNTFLGKVHIKILPGLAFSMGYFTLQN